MTPLAATTLLTAVEWTPGRGPHRWTGGSCFGGASPQSTDCPRPTSFMRGRSSPVGVGRTQRSRPGGHGRQRAPLRQGAPQPPLASRRIIEDAWLQESHSNQFIQAADLVVHAAFQSVVRQPARAFMWGWYPARFQTPATGPCSARRRPCHRRRSRQRGIPTLPRGGDTDRRPAVLKAVIPGYTRRV